MLNLYDTKNINSIKEMLVKRLETLAVAESVTAGYLQAAMATAQDASQFYQGGLTAYNLGQKCRHLLIEPIHAEACNCVSDRIAREMALNVCTLFQSDWGIGITGYAAPVPESDKKLFAFYAIAHKGEIIAENKLEAFKDEPLTVQLFYVNEILKDLAMHLRDL